MRKGVEPQGVIGWRGSIQILWEMRVDEWGVINLDTGEWLSLEFLFEEDPEKVLFNCSKFVWGSFFLQVMPRSQDYRWVEVFKVVYWWWWWIGNFREVCGIIGCSVNRFMLRVTDVVGAPDKSYWWLAGRKNFKNDVNVLCNRLFAWESWDKREESKYVVEFRGVSCEKNKWIVFIRENGGWICLSGWW